MEILKDRYQFLATYDPLDRVFGNNVLTCNSAKMYKTKIKECQLQKYYKANEKEAVLELLERVQPSTATNIRIDIRGRPAKMHRVFRHSKARGIIKAGATKSVLSRESALDSLAHSVTRDKHQEALAKRQQHHNRLDGPTSTLKHDTNHSLWLWQGPFLPLTSPQEVGAAEQTLFEVSHYFRAYFSIGESFQKRNLLRSQPFFGQSILSDIVDTYGRACNEAACSNYQKARILLNRAHRQLHLATHAEHSQLLDMIFTTINTPSNNPRFETAQLFGRFAVEISRLVLGSDHPITKAIQRYGRMSATVATKEEFVRRFRLMRLDVAQAALGHRSSNSDRLTAMPCHSVDDPQYARKLQEAVYNYESQYGPDQAALLSAMHVWAGFHWRGTNDMRVAESGFKKVLIGTQGALPTAASNHARLRALKGLVVIADRQGRWDEGESRCREALLLSVKELGHAHYYTIRLAEWLADLISQQGRREEAQQVAMDHGLEYDFD